MRAVYNKNTFLNRFYFFSKKKKVSSKSGTEKYRFAEKLFKKIRNEVLGIYIED